MVGCEALSNALEEFGSRLDSFNLVSNACLQNFTRFSLDRPAMLGRLAPKTFLQGIVEFSNSHAGHGAIIVITDCNDCNRRNFGVKVQSLQSLIAMMQPALLLAERV